MADFFGFHGTSVEKSSNIIREEFKIINKEGENWLGSGVYFFEKNKNMARYWAGNKFKAPISVFKCKITVSDQEILDVTDPNSEQSVFFHEYRVEVIDQLKRHKADVVVKQKKDFDGKVFNLVCKRFGYNLVRANTFTYTDTDRTLDTFSRISNGTELCVKKPSLIVKPYELIF